MFKRRTIRRLLLLLVASSVCVPALGQNVSDEDVKLALIYKISRFVTWPEVAEQPDAPFQLCVAERSIFELASDRFAGRSIRNRDIDVSLLTDDSETHSVDCDVLYMARAKQDRVNTLLKLVDGEPVLTISDDPDFAKNGGMIGLSTRGKKVSISINVDAYESSDLAVSSQLLELAEIVDGERIARR